jgi:hypothetical protein
MHDGSTVDEFIKHADSTFVHHLAAQPKILGIIAWLLHCSSLAACAKDMAASRLHLIVAMNAKTVETY